MKIESRKQYGEVVSIVNFDDPGVFATGKTKQESLENLAHYLKNFGHRIFEMSAEATRQARSLNKRSAEKQLRVMKNG